MAEHGDQNLGESTADEIDSFLRKRMIGRTNGEHQLTEAESRERASKIAAIEEDIADSARIFGDEEYYDDHHRPKKPSDPISIVVHNQDVNGEREVEATGFTQALAGLGDVIGDGETAINFYSASKFEEEFNRDLGIKAPYYFSVSLFTDHKSYPTIKAMRDRGELSSEFLYTSYHFDREGNSAKLIQLPIDFPDDRPTVWQDKYYKTVSEKLTIGDFELAETAIDLMKEGINRSVKDRINL